MYKAHKRGRRFIIDIAATLVGAAIIALLFYAAYYNTRFYPGTLIEGIDCSGLTVDETHTLLEKQLMSRQVKIVSSKGVLLLSLPLGELYSDQMPLAQRLEEIMANQQRCFLGFFIDSGDEYSLSWTDCADLLPIIDSAAEGQDVTALDSALVETAEGWTITASADGSRPDSAACAQALADTLSAGDNGQKEICVTVGGIVVPPAIKGDDDNLNQYLTAINRALAVEVTVDFGAGLMHTLSYEQLRRVYDIKVDGEGVEITYMPDSLRTVADEIIEQLGADGTRRKYGVIDRDEYYYDESWDKGFVLQRETLYSQLDALLSMGKDGTVVAEYDYTTCFIQHYDHPWVGDTYIEISIANQHMWYYVNGQLLVDTPVVTGCVADGDDTRKGVFYVKYLDERAFLSGGSTNRGGGYWVDYWMPFDGHIGLHDAQWVTEFGGDIYLENGSHGCVNTPLEAMKIIFENTERFCTVVVY